MITPIDKYVIDQVRSFRQTRRISQAKLALEMELPTSFIAQIESGKYDKKYNVSHLDALAQIFECSPKDFLPDRPMQQPQSS